MLSSVAATVAPDDWRQAGVTAWLTKPVRQAHLLSVLVKVLAGKDASQTGSTHELPALRLDCAVAGGKVLLVEDNAVNQEVARGMATSLGATVVSAWTGQAGFDALKAQRFDVVLMDCHMPELDGYEATRRIREWEARHQCARTPILALTANALQGDAQKCLAAGMDAYLSKPFTLDELQAALNALLSGAVATVEGSTRVPSPAAAQLAFSPAVASRVQPTAASTDAGPLDPRALDTIRGMQRAGAPNLLHRVITVYLDSSRQLVAALNSALSTGDAKAVKEAAHSLKSSSANVGAMGLSHVCRALEAAGSSGNLVDAAALWQALVHEHEQATQALVAERERTAA
jgi:CheY-like chemotaxis protein/HPt (histidine-containing phosphotransfer) domain-containing protein